MAWDDKAGRAVGGADEKYIVLQVVLTEKFLGGDKIQATMVFERID